MPDTSPTPVDTRELLRQVIDDAVLTHTGRSVGDVASGRVADDVLAELRTLRASIGPDSERIRECPRCANEISDVRDVSCDVCAAGLLPGPDDIVVSREALREVVLNDSLCGDARRLLLGKETWCPSTPSPECNWCVLAAALSQPPSEETP